MIQEGKGTVNIPAHVESNSMNVAWFDEDPSEDKIPVETRRLLESYSGVPPAEVFRHVVVLRDEAWKVHPYPCIGQFRFIEPSFSHLEDEFKEIVERLTKGEKFLDLACCFGQTIRQLVASGAPAENMLGCDLQNEFIDLGYRLFKDQDRLRATFLAADIFDPSSRLMDLKGSFNMIFAGSFFHLWGYKKQKEVSRIVAGLLHPAGGSMILGRQIGAMQAAEQSSATGTMYRHNVESFKQMWQDIGTELGINFEITASLKPLTKEHFNWHTSGTRRLWFVVRRR